MVLGQNSQFHKLKDNIQDTQEVETKPLIDDMKPTLKNFGIHREWRVKYLKKKSFWLQYIHATPSI